MPSIKRILVVDDNPADRFLLERAFQKGGMRVHLNFVEDGQEAVHYLQGADKFADRTLFPFPDLLLLDLKMPRMDGFDVLRWVREQPGMHRLIVTMLTGSGLDQDIDTAYRLGVNSFLVKPTISEDMAHLVRRVHDYWLDLNCPPNCAERM